MSLKVVNKTAKVNYYGIEVDPEVTWNCWEPGNKYTKKLILKNVKFVTQKLNFSVPAKEVFTTTFPKTITLSAGTSFCLPITFKPHRRDVFEDQICFQNNDGDAFTVPVKALLPQFSVDVPERVSCGIVAAHDVAKKKVSVENKSELDTPFKWCVDDPYSIEPSTGTIGAFSTMTFTLYFKPKDVSTFTMTIPFLYGHKFEYQKLLIATSVAKYPNIAIMVEHLSLEDVLNEDGQIVVDFGVVSVGKCHEKLLKIQNPSQVDASVELFRCDNSNPYDCVFSCPLDSSPVPSGTCLNIMLQYRPKLTLTNYVENFLVRVSNKCGSYKLKCVGASDGPQVALSHCSVNFFQLKPNETATQPITLTNHNPYSEISFQFVLDSATSVFQLDKVDGRIGPQESVQLVVTFRPQAAIQYHRRVACLVPDQDPIFLDLLGTCHDIDNRPHILQKKHIDVFKARQLAGLSFHPPEMLANYVSRKLVVFDEAGHLQTVKKEDSEEQLQSTYEVVPHLSNWKEYFFSNNEADVVFSTPYIGQDVHSLYFNGVEYIEKPQIKSLLFSGALDKDRLDDVNRGLKQVCLKNNTKGAVIIHWTKMSGHSETQTFAVSPGKCEISSGETVVFDVTFSPNGSDRMFAADLEAYAFFKSQRQFELVDERFLSPPFCVLLRCTGHTFVSDHQPFPPVFKFDHSQVIFPSVNTGETAFRSLSLTNLGDQPLLFNAGDLPRPFSMKPDIGHISPGGRQIFTIRCEPSTIDQYLGSMDIHLNNRKDFVQNIPLLGSADNATVVLDNQSQLFFPPTNVGNTSSQRYAIKNTSRISLKFTWKLKPDDLFLTRTYPDQGLLVPNEIQTQQWFFSPRCKGRLVVKALLMVQGISPFGSLTEPKYFPLRIIGHGEVATIAVSGPTDLQFQPIVVGSSAFQTFDLINTSDASVYYHLFFTKDDHFEASQCRTASAKGHDLLECLKMTDAEGLLPGRCKKAIQVTVRPHARWSYKFNIGYSLVDNDQAELDVINRDNSAGGATIVKSKVIATKEDLVSVSMTGVFPTLQITDVQGSGGGQWDSKVNLWRNMSLDNFNVCLDSDPTTSELIFTMATRASFYKNVPVTTRALIDMNLGAAPQNSDSTEIRILFENCGSVETKLAFLFPADLEIELEYWAETGKYTEEELHQMKVQDNHLFDIQPRQAVIAPGASVTVCIVYNHNVVGTDRLPVLMKLDRGREILLNLTGVTLHLERCYIHFASNKHVFKPTPIGLSKTPVQYYEVHNSGAVPVHFELDTAPLARLTQDNYDIPVLQCLNPVGDVQPGQTLRLEWIFTPMEPRTYTVDLPFHMNNGDCPCLQLTAIGYDPRVLGDSLDPGQSGAPSVQSILLPRQTARLSVERISLGTTPTFSIARRLVFLNNIAPTDRSLTFSWNVTDPDDADYVYVSPQQGVLLPNESVACHVVFQAGSVPRFFDVNLICEIYDERELARYRLELDQWHQQQERQGQEFVITDASVGGRQRPVKEPERAPKVPVTSSLPPVVKSPSKSRLLSTDKSSSSTSNKTLSELTSKNRWYKPEMPKPFYLNLGISGRTCPLDDFKREYPSQVDRCAINRPAMLQQMVPLDILTDQKEERAVFPLESHRKEKNVVEAILTEIIGSITDDVDFLDAVRNIEHEATPYYVQLPRACPQLKTIDSGAICDFASGVSADGSNPTRRPDEDADMALLKAPAFGALIESILENMVFNIVSESNSREVDLTSRPRLIALPPRSGHKAVERQNSCRN